MVDFTDPWLFFRGFSWSFTLMGLNETIFGWLINRKTIKCRGRLCSWFFRWLWKWFGFLFAILKRDSNQMFREVNHWSVGKMVNEKEWPMHEWYMHPPFGMGLAMHFGRFENYFLAWHLQVLAFGVKPVPCERPAEITTPRHSAAPRIDSQEEEDQEAYATRQWSIPAIRGRTRGKKE